MHGMGSGLAWADDPALAGMTDIGGGPTPSVMCSGCRLDTMEPRSRGISGGLYDLGQDPTTGTWALPGIDLSSLGATVQANLQARAATFLALKAPLLSLAQSAADPVVRGQAQQLYSEQVSLENQLTPALAAFQAVQAGTASPETVGSNLVTWGQLAYQIDDHVQRSSDFLSGKALGGLGVGPFGLPWSVILLVGVGGLALWAWRR